MAKGQKIKKKKDYNKVSQYQLEWEKVVRRGF